MRSVGLEPHGFVTANFVAPFPSLTDDIVDIVVGHIIYRVFESTCSQQKATGFVRTPVLAAEAEGAAEGRGRTVVFYFWEKRCAFPGGL